MLPLYLTVIYLIVNTDALSIGTVRAHNVTKREGNIGDLFPDWVPFKNKHGDELGEFVQIKAKPKKRLALPVNFILRAVAEPEGDDYSDKSQGDSNGDEYFEKKEWSDTNRAEPEVENNNQNHTEISEIDGVVDIITKRPNNPVVEALKKAKETIQPVLEIKETSTENTPKTQETPKEELEVKSAPESEDKPEKHEEETDDDDDENSEKQKHDTQGEQSEQSESEAKKARILDSVDELKERHAEEQREINEKLKEEEMQKEEREREDISAQVSNLKHDKYDDLRPKSKKLSSEYEDYDENDLEEEKYSVTPVRTKGTTAKPPKRTKKPKRNKEVETGKLSVFKNPQLYIVYDDEHEDINSTPKPKSKSKRLKNRGKETKYSSKYRSLPANTDENVRISLVPDESIGKEGEPTLFFPKKRKSKKRKAKTTLTDSTFAETVSGNGAKELTAIAMPDITASGSDTTAESATISGSTDSVPSNTAVKDAITASTDHKAEEKPENYHREKGVSREHSSSHNEEHNEVGKKAYEGVHKDTKSAKGHHEKEKHLDKYDDHGGIDNHSEEESGHYGIHHHEEHGKKHAKYEESGKHSKGHSTKGSHDIHKKDEYEKKVEFFEEEGDSSEEEKHGGYNHEHGHSKGGHFKKGDYNAGHSQHSKGDSGSFGKGGRVHVSKGHKDAAGHDGHGRNGSSRGKKGGKDSGKKWTYYHGHPAKTAGLVRIDRRADQYYYGPHYYG